MKKIASYIAFLMPLFLIISCVFNDKIIKEESNITISGQKYTHIVLTNESDTVNGYYYVLNDSLFFLSKAIPSDPPIPDTLVSAPPALPFRAQADRPRTPARSRRSSVLRAEGKRPSGCSYIALHPAW